MIKSLTNVHSIIVRGGNVVAQLIVTRLNKKFSKSNDRALKAIALREDIIFSTKLVVDEESNLRKNLRIQIAAATRLVNA